MITYNKKILLLLLLAFGLCQGAVAQDYTKTKYGIKAKVGQTSIEVEFYTPASVRIIKSPEDNFTKESLSVIAAPEKTKVDVSQKGDLVFVNSSILKTQLNVKTGVISFLTPDGKILLNEKENGAEFTPVKDVDTDTYKVKQSFLFGADEALYGLGMRQNGKMIQRDIKVLMRQENMKMAIPFLQSVNGYGIFWDNYAPTTYEDSKTGTSFESEVGDGIDYYFMYGKNADGVIAQMRLLTGQVPMFPYWTFGYWQSKERYVSQAELNGVVKKYRELGVPLDGIIQDWQYWGDNTHWNGMTFLNPEFPNPKQMIDEVHKDNAHMIISIWASFGPETDQYKIMKPKGQLLNIVTWPIDSGAKPYDVYSPQARDIYWNHLNKGIFSLGMDGWWMDSTEPDHFDITEKDFDNKTYLGSFRKVRNAFPLMTVGGVSSHQRKATSDKRVFILTRSAFTGQQRYGANTWSGDVVSKWDVFRDQISSGLNFALTGIPYWNTDIGGFFAGQVYPKGVKDPAFQELYVRWLQFGAFSNMMRSHGTDTPREIYQFGNKGDWAYDAIDKYINLRYKLLPYIYSNAWEVTTKSSTLTRALVMDFPQDKKALSIDNEFMFGKSILVCPITEGLYTKAGQPDVKPDFSKVKTHLVYLPQGTEWFDFWTGEKLKGGQELQREAPVDIMPLYVKAGSIVPMGPKVQYANEKKDPIELRVYPGADAVFELYDDERDNYNYEKGSFSIIKIEWNDKKQQLTINNQQGAFTGMLTGHTFNMLVVGKGKGVGTHDAVPAKTIKYTGKKEVVTF